MASRVSDVDSAGEMLEVHLVPMRRRHLRSVLRIESQVYPRPWSIPLFMSELNLRTTRAYWVARVAGTVVGYTGLMLADEDAHVTTMAVDPVWHRHKIGTRLMLNLLRTAGERGATRVTLEVRMGNEGAQALYRRFGFQPAGVRKNYYAETREDALIMWANDIGTDAYATLLAGIEAGIPGSTVIEPAGGWPG